VKTHPEDDVINYMIAYENVTGASPEALEQELISRGWNIELKADFDEAWFIQAIYNEEAFLSVGIEEDNSGMINLSILR
jgi:hypothetical protein